MGSATGLANTNVIPVNSVTGLVVGESVTGTNVPAGSVITAINATTNTISINNNIATAVASTTHLTFGTVGVQGAAGESFTGAVTIAGGVLEVQPSAATGPGSAPLSAVSAATTTNNIVFTTDPVAGTGYAGGTFQLLGTPTGVGSAPTTTVGALTLTAGAGTIMTTAVGGGTPTLEFMNTAPITRSAGAVVDFEPGAGANIEFNTSPTQTNGIIGGYAYFTNSTTQGVDFAVVTGSSAPFVVSAPTYGTSGSFINALPVSGSTSTVNYLSNGVSVTTTASESINSLKLMGTQTLTLGGILTIGTGGVLFDDSTGAATITNTGNSAFTLGRRGQELIVTVAGSNPANALTINAPIGNTTASLTKAGSGTLIISGANNFTGNVTIDEGTVQLSGANATLGLITTVGNVTTVRQNATLDLNAAGGGTITIGALAGAGTVTNSGGGAGTAVTLNIGQLDVTTTATAVFSGLLTDGAGVLNVTKNGSGTQYLNPLNGAFYSTTPAQTVTVTATTGSNNVVTVSSTAGLAVGDVLSGSANIPAGAVITGITSPTTFTISMNATPGTFSETATPTGGQTQTLGTLGYNTYSGVTTVAQGTLSVVSLANYGSESSIGTGLAQSNAASLVLGAPNSTASGILQYIGENQEPLHDQYAVAFRGDEPLVHPRGQWRPGFLGRHR